MSAIDCLNAWKEAFGAYAHTFLFALDAEKDEYSLSELRSGDPFHLCVIGSTTLVIEGSSRPVQVILSSKSLLGNSDRKYGITVGNGGLGKSISNLLEKYPSEDFEPLLENQVLDSVTTWIELARNSGAELLAGGWTKRAADDPVILWANTILSQLWNTSWRRQSATIPCTEVSAFGASVATWRKLIEESVVTAKASGVANSKSNRSTRPDREEVDYETELRENEIFEAWQRAKQSGTTKKEFIKDGGFTGNLRDLDKLLNKLSMRKRRGKN